MELRFEDTICAPATIAGTGAISLIRVSGPETFKVADKVVKCLKGTLEEAPGYRLKFGKIYSSDGSLVDEVLVSVFHAPHSYTGEDSVEISCHASAFIVDAILQLLMDAGARMAMPGEFTRRAFVNGKLDLAQAEAVADVIASQNAASHRVAMNQLKGGFSSELKEMRAELLKIVSLMELELDFSEEEVEFADRQALVGLVDATLAHISKLIESFRLGNAIKNGIPVAIVGAANAGKSTLLNALLGEDRAIVSDIAGTTRDTIEESLNISGHNFRFIDTAGLRETDETIEKIGIERSYKMLEKADIVLALFDATESLETIEKSFNEIVSHVDFKNQKFIPIINKIDDANRLVADGYGWMEIVNKFVNIKNNIVTSIDTPKIDWYLAISASNYTGIDSIKEMLSDYAQKISANCDETLVTNLRHLEALKSSRTSLSRVRDGLNAQIPTDLVAQDIRETLYYLGSIVGEISTDEVLGNIFEHFCIGK